MELSFVKKILKSIPDTVLVIDTQGIVQHINFSNSILKKKEHTGQHWNKIFPPKTHSIFKHAFEKVISSNKSVQFKHTIGGKGYWKITLTSVQYDQEKNGKIMVLTEEPLDKTTEGKEKQFLANIIHEIRTPLDGIIGLIHLLLGTEASPVQREYLNIIQKSTENLLALINDFLIFSKIETQKLHIETIDFCLQDDIYEVLHTLTVRAAEKGLELICDILPDEPSWIVGDPKRINQIIMNLAGNAIKFTEEGEVILKIMVEPGSQTKEKTTIHFTVIDSGIGIPKEKQSLIFEAFTQARKSTSREFGGTGLGLTISEQLVNLLGGKIWVESPIRKKTIGKEGPGSAFHFLIPFKLSKKKDERFDDKKIKKLKDVSILVAEDNTSAKDILKNMLTRFQMVPTFVKNGREALAEMNRAIIDGAPYPLALLDSNMPDKNGFDVAEQVRWDSELAGSVIIMLSTVDIKQDIVRCTQLGIATQLVKPVKETELFIKLIHALNEQQTGQEDSSLAMSSNQIENILPRVQIKGSARILLIDDYSTDQLILMSYLRKRGWETVSVPNVRRALQILESEIFNCILIDVQEDHSEGIKTTALIRQQEKQKKNLYTPIIIIADEMKNIDRQKYIETGATDCAIKPFQAEVLYNRIEKQLDKQQIKQILIIEDNPAFQKILQSMLNSNGYHVITAGDGLEGFNMARKEKPDLIIVDLLLPQMDGHEVINMLKLDKELRKIPIIIFTQRNLEDDVKLARKYGVDAYLLKSYKPDILLDKVNQLI